MKKYKILLSFGANLSSPSGDPMATIHAAKQMLEQKGCEGVNISRLYRTPALTLPGQGNVPDFCNAAAVARVPYSPHQILELFHEVEACFGRERTARWSARTLDIDLIAYEDLVMPDKETWLEIAHGSDPAAYIEDPMVPHPRMHQRGFVLKPLMDVAPDWYHPVLGKSVSELCSEMGSSGGFEDISEITADRFL